MANPVSNDSTEFQTRFQQRKQVERYRERFLPGGHKEKIHQHEQAVLRRALTKVGKVDVAMDLPAGTGRLSPVLGEIARKVIVADASDVMLEVAREDNPTLAAEYLVTPAEEIRLADGAVDLVFCHRFLNHIVQQSLRARIFGEFARVTKRFVMISFNSASVRSRVRWRLKRLVGLVERGSQPATMEEFLGQARKAGLRLVHREMISPQKESYFCLFEKEGK